MEIQTIYQHALKFAASKHAAKQQMVPGTNLPYAVHISNVAMEIIIASYNSKDFDLAFALPVALLHDTLEDTSATYEEIKTNFSEDIAKAVSALTKNESLSPNEKMADSLNRIKSLSKEVWAVKLADRITNLQKPPSSWDNNKKGAYLREAKDILIQLKGGNEYLENRLSNKIAEYRQYINVG